ncbi:MAG TPA: penicillin-binding protein 2 [Candidatus Limnocylindrales bacterium]|nr:penicillin-binding protein 2 [Candidatus Limnocylindrales bacterium]
MSGPHGRGGPQGGGAPPLGRGILRLALALAVAYVGLGLGLSYWQVVQAPSLASDPGNPLVMAAAREAPRGEILDARGVVLAKDVRATDGSRRRTYPQPLAAPFLGYQSPIFGTAGLERAFDAQLSGLVPPSPLDALLGKFRDRPYVPSDVVTSIDMRLQREAMRLLGSQRGAVVAMDPTTGRILALASSPTFDPARIVDPDRGRAYLASLRSQTAAAPLLDRATEGRYVPGSVFKIVTSIAGLGSGAITPATTYPDQPAEERSGFLVDGFRVTDGHHLFTGSTALDYSQALQVSCNIWFAHAGLAIGAADLRDWARRLGFEAPIPFDLPAAASQVTGGGGPDDGFQDEVELANAAYGQAETLVTPLQMALVASTVADGGVLMKPQLVTEVRPAEGTADLRAPETWRRVLDPSTATVIREAMVQAVSSDWGRRFAGPAQVPGVPTAGKSGTAQLGSGEPHSWFIGFAPADAPRIAVAVVIERAGEGSGAAVPLGGKLMAYDLGLDR